MSLMITDAYTANAISTGVACACQSNEAADMVEELLASGDYPDGITVVGPTAYGHEVIQVTFEPHHAPVLMPCIC